MRDPGRTGSLRRALGLVVASLVALGASGACRQVVGIEERTAKCGGLAFAESACAECMDTECCEEASACSDDAACRSGAERLNACGMDDASCRIAARAAAPPNNAALSSFGTCRLTSCASACNSCGGLVDPLGASCDACIRTACCNLGSSCAADENCSKAFACIRSCDGPPDCPSQCLQGPYRNDTVVALFSCIQDACDNECKYGEDWECVDHGSWGAPPTKTPINYEVRVTNFLTQKRVPGVTVTPCATFVGGCSEGGVTDENGVVVLAIPVTPPVDWTGYFRLSAPEYEDLIAKSNKPLTKDDFGTMYMVKSDELVVLAAQFKVPLDDTKALVFVTALDCNGFNAPGIQFQLTSKDPGILSTYFSTAGADPTVTNKFGTVAFGNVPIEGTPLGISMYLDGVLMGDAIVPIEPGKMTEVGLYPRL